MDKKDAESNAKFLAAYIETELSSLLQKSPIEQLEIIQERLFGRNQVLNDLLSDLVDFSKEIESKLLFYSKFEKRESCKFADLQLSLSLIN